MSIMSERIKNPHPAEIAAQAARERVKNPHPRPEGERPAARVKAAETPAGTARPSSSRPSNKATKPEWVAFVVAQGELDHDEAEALTKADLIELYDE